jgi:DNA-binding transcriptional LysR family regulator
MMIRDVAIGHFDYPEPMDMRRFAAFVTVADVGGISAAASSLSYAQSTVSMQLRSLEEELGVRLVERTPGGSRLTDAGQRLLPYAREALELAERMRRAMHPERGELRIGALESLAAEWLPDILTALRLGAVGDIGVPVEVTVEGRAALAEGLASGRLDVTFVFDNGTAPLGPWERVDEEAVVLVCAPDHPLARRRKVSQEALMSADFLVAERGCTADMLVNQLGHDIAVQAPVAMVTGSLAALRRLVANGHGVALLPYLTAAPDLESGALVCLEVPFAVRPVGIEARWRADAEPEVLRRVASLVTLARRNTLRTQMAQKRLA